VGAGPRPHQKKNKHDLRLRKGPPEAKNDIVIIVLLYLKLFSIFLDVNQAKSLAANLKFFARSQKKIVDAPSPPLVDYLKFLPPRATLRPSGPPGRPEKPKSQEPKSYSPMPQPPSTNSQCPRLRPRPAGWERAGFAAWQSASFAFGGFFYFFCRFPGGDA
jgi:hypothetical protein